MSKDRQPNEWVTVPEDDFDELITNYKKQHNKIKFMPILLIICMIVPLLLNIEFNILLSIPYFAFLLIASQKLMSKARILKFQIAIMEHVLEDNRRIDHLDDE